MAAVVRQNGVTVVVLDDDEALTLRLVLGQLTLGSVSADDLDHEEWRTVERLSQEFGEAL